MGSTSQSTVRRSGPEGFTTQTIHTDADTYRGRPDERLQRTAHGARRIAVGRVSVQIHHARLRAVQRLGRQARHSHGRQRAIATGVVGDALISGGQLRRVVRGAGGVQIVSSPLDRGPARRGCRSR